jgi:hypothetical protein
MLITSSRTLLLPLLAGLITHSSLTAASAPDQVLRSGQQQNTLIELYTSQGCSSCPPAERWLGSLQQDPRLWNELIPVAFHVDYWDYIGWKDQLAQPAFSQRQRQYNREKGLSSVYTPGFVVNGQEWRSWFGLRKLPKGTDSAGVLTVTLAGDSITASYQPRTPSNGPMRLNLAIVGVGISANVTRGENAGKVLPQDFSVLAFKQEDSTGRQWHTTLPQVDNSGGARLAIAAWVSNSHQLIPLQAVGGWLPQKR